MRAVCGACGVVIYRTRLAVWCGVEVRPEDKQEREVWWGKLGLVEALKMYHVVVRLQRTGVV